MQVYLAEINKLNIMGAWQSHAWATKSRKGLHNGDGERSSTVNGEGVSAKRNWDDPK